jgi:hypothetical protein
MLNLLSMDFNIHERYADLIRWASTGAKPLGRRRLGLCYTFGLVGQKPASTIDVTKPADLARWRRHYGGTVLDFGAGFGAEAELLRSVGVDAYAFDPYVEQKGKRKLDVDASRDRAREFLGLVASKKRWSSIFCSAVLNSIPFAAERRHVVTLLAALSGPGTLVNANGSSKMLPGYRLTKGVGYLNRRDASRMQFRLGYEPGITLGLGHADGTPTVQKFFGRVEFGDLFRERFASVVTTVGKAGNNIEVVAARPRVIRGEDLSAACAYEFDLPFPNGERMGLASEAIASFRSRCLRDD